MISRRGIVIIVLIGLAVVASSTHPWVSGSNLLADKYSSMFDPYINTDTGIIAKHSLRRLSAPPASSVWLYRYP